MFDDRILLNWTASCGATSYEVYRVESRKTPESSPEPGDLIGEVSDNTFEDVSGLELNKIYYYCIKAKNAAGVSEFSAYNSGYLSELPPPPSAITVSDGTFFNKIRVSWPKMKGAVSYEVYRNTADDFSSSSKIADVPYESMKKTFITASDGTKTTYIYYLYDDPGDDLLNTVPETKYYYWVKSYNESGASELPSRAGAGFLSSKGPSSLKASNGTVFDKIRINWSAVAGATGYDVYRYTDKQCSQEQTIFNAGANLFYDDTSAVAGTSYYYKAKAKYKDSYTSLFSPSDSGYHFPNVAKLTVPIIRHVSKGEFGFVRITWSAVDLAENYKIYRNTVKEFATSTPIATTASTCFDDMTVIPDTKYWYWVKANNDTADATSMLSKPKSGHAKGTSNDISDGGSSTADGAEGSFKFYAVEVPKDTTRLIITLSGTSGGNDCDLYAKFASYPSLSSYNAKGLEIAGGKRLTATNPVQGTWYILLYGRTAYADVTVTVNCYSVTDIVLKQVPSNDLSVPYKANFKGQVVDSDGIGIPGMIVKARNPITGLTTVLNRTDASGFFKYSDLIKSEGEHTFDFFFTEMPDAAKGTASHTVASRKGCLEDNRFFDMSAYIPAKPAPVADAADVQGLQNFLDTRNGWDDDAIDGIYAAKWVESTLVKAKDDTQLAGKLDEGLYMFFYGVEGAGVGNDMTVYSALSAVPFVVHVEDSKKAGIVAKLKLLGLIDDTQEADMADGKIGIIAVTSLSNPDESSDKNYNISLLACEQLELLADIAAGEASFVEDGKYSDTSAKTFTVTLANGRKINVVGAGFVK